jgi:hypothetical protein
MIPASQGVPTSYFFSPNAIRGTRAQINSVTYDDLRNGNLVAGSANIRPGRACAFAPGSTGGNSYQPNANITSIVPAFVAADFAGIISGDIWQERIGAISNAVDADTQTVEAIPGDLIPRAVAGEWWVEVSTVTGVARGGAVSVLTAAGPNQGAFAPTGGVVIPQLLFTGKVATVGGLPFAVVKFMTELVA